MKIQRVAGTRAPGGEPPRSTAYYYADLERLKRGPAQEPPQDPRRDGGGGGQDPRDPGPAADDGAAREVPPLRDRGRQWSLPEYSTPENSRKVEETYSTAGTFPMPEPKEKEPLLAELEVVGRLPLSQLDSTGGAGGVRRSRSWYLCCPDVADEELSRDSSWRYSSLRPVTAPPAPAHNHNHLNIMTATHRSGREDVTSLRAERDALARALSSERARAAAAARAHDARLAELHGVIAELVRRRAHDKHARAIPEEDVDDECESSTQPAGELDDADHSRTEQNDTSSALSPELPTPQESKVDNTIPPSTFEELPTDTETSVQDIRADAPHAPQVEVTSPSAGEQCDTSLNLSERDSDLCLSTARCCDGDGGGGGDGEGGGLVVGGGGAGGAGGVGGASEGAGGSCERERGSPDSPRLYTPCTGACASRQAKLASRVKLRRTDDSDSTTPRSDHWLCSGAAERLALDVCAHADLREALLAADHQHDHHGGGCVWAARCGRLRAERRVLQCALARAADTAHRLYCACAIQESTSVSLCCALRAADRALETYDVLLALAETAHTHKDERESTEQVASQLLARLDAEQTCATIGEPLLSPGPWQQHHHQSPRVCEAGWGGGGEARLRAHAARLKADTVLLRNTQPGPKMFSYHDVEESELLGCSAAEMEAAVAVHDALAHAHRPTHNNNNHNNNNNNADCEHTHKSGSSSRRRPRSRPRHWLDTHASETDL